MRLTPRKFGVLAIAVGLLAPIAVFAWSATIRRSIVDLPLPLHPGTVRQDFSVDYDGHYIVGIEMNKSLSSQTIDCLFGAQEIGSEGALECNHTPPVLDFQWKLIRDNQTVVTSTSTRLGRGPSSAKTIMANFDIFQAQPGHRYEVLLEFAQDASKMEIGQPRLRVVLDPWSYEEIIVGQALSELFCFVCLLIGGLVLAVSWWKARRRANVFPLPNH